MAAAAVYGQSGFRLREDDGSETTATWKAATNVAEPSALGVPFRIRFLIFKAAAAAADVQHMVLFESHNGGTFTQVTSTSGTKSIPFVSANYADEDICTQQIGAGIYNTTVNNLCMMNEVLNARTGSTTYAADAGNETEQEMEVALTIAPGVVSNGDTIEYRMRNGFDAFVGGYTNVPILTIVKGGIRINGGVLQVTGG